MHRKNTSSTKEPFDHLIKIMAQLRGKHGCPWDKEQTHESLRQFLLEETYEVLEAIDQKNHDALKEELGDLLLQIVFHAQIAAENDVFNMAEIIATISDKLIRRHPNVFGDVKIDTAEEQSIHWEKLKKHEGKASVLDGVPKALSALLRAWRIQQKASTVGFDWAAADPVWDKIHEEIDELKQASEQEDNTRIEEEFGDLIFSLVNIARFMRVNPEDALRKTTEKFISRFQQIEHELALKNREMRDVSLEELDAIWERIKVKESE